MSPETLGWLLVGAGVTLALVGRQVFWLAVGLVGFLVTSSVAQALLPDLDPTVRTIAALAIGALGAVITLRSLRLVASVAGALLLAIVARALFVLYLGDSAWQWLAFAVAGALGWMLVRGLFDIGIIVTTALGGGWYVATGIGATQVDVSPSTALWLGLAAAVVGIVVQSGGLRRSRAPRPATTQAPPQSYR
jgi:hypothetical protein